MPPIPNSRARLLRTSRHVDAAHRHSKIRTRDACARSRSISRSFVRCAAQSCVAVYRRAIGASIASIDRSIASAKYLAHRSRARVDPVVRRITIRDDTPATSMRARQKRDLEVRGADADDGVDTSRVVMIGGIDVRGVGRRGPTRCGCGGRSGFTVAVMGRVTVDVWARDGDRGAKARAHAVATEVRGLWTRRS